MGHFLRILCLFSRSDLTAQDPILKIRVLASLGTLQDWLGWGIFTVIPGYPRRAKVTASTWRHAQNYRIGSGSNYSP